MLELPITILAAVTTVMVAVIGAVLSLALRFRTVAVVASVITVTVVKVSLTTG
jgi:hypothetical protein